MSVPEHVAVDVDDRGFGGSVLAYRLQEADWQVCLPERGMASFRA